MADLYDEIAEDVKRDNLHLLWNKYGVFLIASLIVVILATGIYVWWKDYTINKYASENAKIVAALSSGEVGDEFINQLEEISKVGSEYTAPIASIKKAHTLLENNEIDKAIELYKEVYENPKFSKEYRSFAKYSSFVLSVNSILSADKFDEKSKVELAEVASDIESFLSSGQDVMLGFSIKDLLANLYVKIGNKEKAQKLFLEIANDNNVPVEIRNRSQEILDSSLLEN